jgi:hypothetical protein
VPIYRDEEMSCWQPVPPYTLGSHASRLMTLLRQGHEKVLLFRKEWIKLVTWVDANAPYYGRLTRDGKSNQHWTDLKLGIP